MQQKLPIPQIFALYCGYQSYQWGQVGEKSCVYRLLKASGSRCQLDASVPYAELWMGTHKNLPSWGMFNNQKINLSSLIQEEGELMLGKAFEKYHQNLNLPFLFKVLSVNMALSIQAHPDKKLAEQLFNKLPDLYKDDNHKPELAVALTEFKALCNFGDKQQIIENCQNTPEIMQIIDLNTFNQFTKETDPQKIKALLKILFQQLFSKSKQQVEQSITQMIKRISAKPNPTARDQLILNLNQQFPLDIGIFVSNFLNYLELKPGESISMSPDEPHAYIYGDCIECMTNSDNVVRAGLTPKFKDTETLINMLTYNMGNTSKLNPEILKQTSAMQFARYHNGFEEFCCYSLETFQQANPSPIIQSGYPIILIVISASGKPDCENSIVCDSIKCSLAQGSAYYVLPNTKFWFCLDKNVKIYMCSCFDDKLLVQ